mmetsp:Transcript_11895/g.14371  ORF Transcript_11895/g.14371 Transcript_11895/m.14371 type:complete len:596 (+) Transcript_11895:84-1871(+)
MIRALIILNLIITVFSTLDIPCPNDISQSGLWETSHLEPCSNHQINLFIEDPWSQLIMHTCGSETKGSLPTTCSDIRFQSIDIDDQNNEIYISSNLAILKGNLNTNLNNNADDISPETNANSFIGGYVIINIYGYNFGSSLSNIIIKVKNELCDTMKYYNESYIQCIIGNPKILLTPILNDSISVTIIGSGHFNSAIPKVMARARLAAGYQQPLVHRIDVIDQGFRPSAITVYSGESPLPSSPSSSSSSMSITSNIEKGEGRVYWYNRASYSIQSCNLYGKNMIQHSLNNLGRISNLKIDKSGRFLFASNQHERNIIVFDLYYQPSRSSSSYDNPIPNPTVVINDISEPWGLVLDEVNGFLFVAESGKNRILRYEGLNPFLLNLKKKNDNIDKDVDFSTSTSIINPLTKFKVIVSVNTGVQLTDITLLGQTSTSSTSTTSSKHQTPALFDMKQKFLWNELNGDKIKISTIHGTRIENINHEQNYPFNQKSPLSSIIWPRSIINDKRYGHEHIFYIAEYFGKIWELSSIDKKHVKLILDISTFENNKYLNNHKEYSNSQPPPSSNKNIRQFLESIGRNGDYLKGQSRSGSFLRVTA